MFHFKFKSKWSMIIGSIIFLVAILVFFTAFHKQSSSNVKNSFINAINAKKISRVRPSLSVKGFTFDSYQGDKKTLFIRADSLVVNKKKIGFFHFGLINVAKLKRGIIDIYVNEKTTHNLQSYFHFDQSITPAKTQKIAKRVDFGNTFLPDTLRSITRKHIAFFEMEPAIIRIHDNSGSALTIESGYLKISLKDGIVTFKKNVRVTSGSNILTTNELRFFPNHCIYRTNRPFVLKTLHQELRGDYLEISLYLDQVFSMQRYSRLDFGHFRFYRSPYSHGF